MGRRRGIAGPKVKKRKKVTVRIIKEKHAGEVTEPHRILQEILRKHHGHLDGARFGLVWRSGWRTDPDGHMKLGQCVKSKDLDREMYAGFDFVILLNEEAWNTLNKEQKAALIDHELCHAALSMDSNGEPKFNDRDRLCCRIKKHDCEEFKCIVERHGLWTQDLEEIAKAAINDAKRPLLKDDKKDTEVATDNTADSGAESLRDVKSNGKGDKKAWRRWDLDCLVNHGLPAGKRKLLDEAGLDTMGKLMDRMNQAGKEDFWWKDVKGFGETGYDAMTEAIVRLRKACPDFQADLA